MEPTGSPSPATAPSRRRKVQPLVLLFALVLVLAIIWGSSRRIFSAGRAAGSAPAAATAPAAP